MVPFHPKQYFSNIVTRIKRRADWWTMGEEESELFLMHGYKESTWNIVQERRQLAKGINNPNAIVWRTNNATGKPEWILPGGKVSAVDPDDVARQVKQKPIVTGKQAHKTVTIQQQSPQPIATPDISQKTRRQNITRNRPAALKSNKKVNVFGPKYKKGFVWTPSMKIPEGAEVISLRPVLETLPPGVAGPANLIKPTLSAESRKLMKKVSGKVAKSEFWKGVFKGQRDYKKRQIVDAVSKVADYQARANLINDTRKLVYYGKQFIKNPWVKRVAGIGLSVVAYNMASSGLKRVFGQNENKAIPDEYERGYDIISENITDFGSPVNLSKAAQKTITPYYSTVRKAVYTNVNTVINSNLSLTLSKKAIGHTRY